jgi:hypothetical protein
MFEVLLYKYMSVRRHRQTGKRLSSKKCSRFINSINLNLTHFCSLLDAEDPLKTAEVCRETSERNTLA